jgi:rubrerythrin
MFTLNDIRNIAIQIERNGEQAYRAAAKKADDPQIGQMFAWMADEELHHLQWFKALQVPSQASLAHDEIETMGRSLLQEMMKNQTFSLENDQLQSITDISGLLVLSLEFENDTILFYEMLRAFIEESETIEQLNVIIAEEQGHVEQLERLKAIYAGKVKENDPNR